VYIKVLRLTSTYINVDSIFKGVTGVTPLKMKPTLVTETSEEKTQTPGKFPEESTLESQRGENLKT
jgi:hypothetical protein